MNDEIKATLEWLKECGNNDYIFETGNSKMLLDYITNLHQENQRLNNVLNKYNNHLIKKMNEFVIYDGDLSKIYEEEFDYFYELNELKESDK